jgi:hypothetical protein
MAIARIGRQLAATCLALTTAAAGTSAQKPDSKDADPRPRVTLRSQPSVSVAPARMTLTAELLGGANDFEEYYCPTVVWEWGDDTTSESTLDCAPYEAGKSEIRRRFTVQHMFRRSGTYKVYFRLKRGDKMVAAQSVTVHVHPGGREYPY